MCFYDRTGKAVAFTDDDTHVFLINGTPVAYIFGDAVYTFPGRQIGWYENGWIRDPDGKAVFFTENAREPGPVRPVKGVTPVKGTKRVLPVKGVRDVRRVKPTTSFQWSVLSGEQFF